MIVVFNDQMFISAERTLAKSPHTKGKVFAFGGRVSVAASLLPLARGAEHFAGVFERGVGDGFSARHAGQFFDAFLMF